MIRSLDRAGARLLPILKGANLLAAAGMAAMLLWFLAASLACGGDILSPDVSLDREDSLAFDELVEANRDLGVEARGIRFDRGAMGRIVAIHAGNPPEGEKLKVLPSSIGDMDALVTLDLAGNALTEVPQALDKLTSLQTLVLAGNGLAALPEDMLFARLRVLDLNSNALQSLPKTFDAVYLEDLNLNYNDLATLPSDLGRLFHLKRLDAAHNRLESLPVDFSGMAVLDSLDLSANRLASLPESLMGLSPDFLDVSGNRICLHLRTNRSPQETSLMEWLDRYDRDWRDTQRCD